MSKTEKFSGPDQKSNSESHRQSGVNKSPYRVKLVVSYDGTDYCGWQKQKHSIKPSVQENLETALARIFKEPVRCISSGRTDTGVHALAQIVHFDAPRNPQGINFVKALRAMLPESIVVQSAESVPKEFHSLLSARAKTYRYVISTKITAPTFMARFCHWYPHRFDLEHLQKLAQVIEGTHDFKSFQSVGTDVPTTIRTIYKARWIQKRPHLYYFEVTGNGFLKQMVRNLVGTQLYFMQKNRTPDDLAHLLLAKDRTQAAYTAPAKGLFLVKVFYRGSLNR
jgi:tRNA pseudouridine38-40 synthase